MQAFFVNTWNRLRASLWFIPSLMAAGAFVLSMAAVAVDRRLPADSAVPLRLFFSGGSGGAGSILSTIAGSMIGVTGVVFSITIVALSLASGQFGPRLLRNFMRDRMNQFVLGTFIATFLYALLGLRSVSPADTDAPVPRVTVVIAIALAVTSLAVLIYFIHHIATSIQADSVVSNVSADLEAAIDDIYPEQLGEPATSPAGGTPELPPSFDRDAVDVLASRSGWVQAIDDDEVLEVAQEHDFIVRIVHRPGEFAISGTPLLQVWPPERCDKERLKRLSGSVIVGSQRTEEQDIEYSIDQLVEVAARSLSPGINDPFTAISCVNHLASALCQVGARKLPSPYRQDEDGRFRIVAKRTTYRGLVDGAFNQIRQYGSGSVAVSARLLEVLVTIVSCTPNVEDRHQVLHEHADRIIADARDADLAASDLDDLEERYQKVISAFDAA